MSRNQISNLRKAIAIVVVGAACLLVAVQYVRLIEPAAAREVQAACRGLKPAAQNPELGAIPTAEPVEFEAKDHTGKTVKLSDFRGKVVFVNFWASWCNVCKAEKPGLYKMIGEMESDDFVVLTLASDHNWDTIREMFPDGAPMTVLLDPPASEDDNLGQIARQFGLTAVPESFVIDRDGYVRYYFINKRDWDSGVAETCLQAVIDA